MNINIAGYYGRLLVIITLGMSREKRNITHPVNYKTFNEEGRTDMDLSDVSPGVKSHEGATLQDGCPEANTSSGEIG